MPDNNLVTVTAPARPRDADPGREQNKRPEALTHPALQSPPWLEFFSPD
jgi:hypothetical protein